MVAQKRGRGAKAAAPKKPAAAAAVEEPVQEAEMTEAPEAAADENNGQEEAVEGADATMEEAEANDSENADNSESAETTEASEAQPEEKKEEKVEPGRLLVENLPPSFLFDYKEKLQEIFSKHGEILSIRRGPLVVTELTTTPTLSAIVEFKNKDSLEQALQESGTEVDGQRLAASMEWRMECSVMVGVPHDVNVEYVRALMEQCGNVANVTEYVKVKNKILRVTFEDKESVARALKVDRELRINGSLVTVNKFHDDDNKPNNPQHNKSKRPSNNQNNRNSLPSPVNNNANRNNNFRPPPRVPAFNARPNFRGAARGRGGFPGRGAYGPGPRGGFVPNAPYMPPPQQFMGRPGGFMDGQRPNKRLRPM